MYRLFYVANLIQFFITEMTNKSLKIPFPSITKLLSNAAIVTKQYIQISHSSFNRFNSCI